MFPVLPSAPDVPSAHVGNLRLVLTLLVLGHIILYAWAEGRLLFHRRRRAALLADSCDDVGEVLGWAVTPRGTEVLICRGTDGGLRAVGAGGTDREKAVLGWLAAEGFLDGATAMDAAGPGGGGHPGGVLDL